MADMFSMQGLEQQISSARQLIDMAEMLRREAEEKTIKRMGAEAQIKSSKILAEQRNELEVMREAISALLKHNLEQSKHQAEALAERDKIESERYLVNTRLSKVAAWAGVIGTLLASAGIALQIASQWKS
jgi:hypothetical protein